MRTRKDGRSLANFCATVIRRLSSSCTKSSPALHLSILRARLLSNIRPPAVNLVGLASHHISEAAESAPASATSDSEPFRSQPLRFNKLIYCDYQGASFFNGHFGRISKDPSGIPQQEWINEVPNDGLIRYTTLLNSERLLITTPKALGEVLVQKNYDFIKPAMVRNGLGRLLGIGVLLAEGDEHKVRQSTQSQEECLGSNPRP